MPETPDAAPLAPSHREVAPLALSHREVLVILLGLMLGMFLAALDQTIVASAMRTIADDLQGLSAQAWVTTAYLITSTIVTPLYGKLSDIFGRRPLFLIAILIFIIGSVLASFSTSMVELAAFRAIQGLGAGGLEGPAVLLPGRGGRLQLVVPAHPRPPSTLRAVKSGRPTSRTASAP